MLENIIWGTGVFVFGKNTRRAAIERETAALRGVDKTTLLKKIKKTGQFYKSVFALIATSLAAGSIIDFIDYFPREGVLRTYTIGLLIAAAFSVAYYGQYSMGVKEWREYVQKYS